MSSPTYAEAVIVGSYVDAAGNDHAFLYSNRNYTTLNFPGGQATGPYGINVQGEIVGAYSGAAFLATPVPSRPPSSR